MHLQQRLIHHWKWEPGFHPVSPQAPSSATWLPRFPAPPTALERILKLFEVQTLFCSFSLFPPSSLSLSHFYSTSMPLERVLLLPSEVRIKAFGVKSTRDTVPPQLKGVAKAASKTHGGKIQRNCLCPQKREGRKVRPANGHLPLHHDCTQTPEVEKKKKKKSFTPVRILKSVMPIFQSW